MSAPETVAFGEGSQAGPPKLAPEALLLRGRPERAIRFKRELIIAIAAVAVIAVVVVAWAAFRHHPNRVLADQDRPETTAPVPADALAKAPASYSDVPRLGPPLPGDLGRPILERQRQLATETGEGGNQQARQWADAERQQRLAELKAARESGLLVQNSAKTATQPDAAGQPATATAANTPAITDPSSGPDKLALDPERDPNAQGRKAAFVAGKDTGGDINPHAPARPVSPYTLSAGSVIAASLITRLRSDLPGLVTAQVTENVYDSATGRFLLIPQGARLIGSHDSVVAFGQRRALVVWQRIVLPDGSSLRIDNVPATDVAGYAGLEDKVDLHTWQLLKGVVPSTLLGVSSELALSGNDDLVQAIRQSTQNSVAHAGDQITQRNLNIQPTITIRPGSPVRLVVHKDLILAPWRGWRSHARSQAVETARPGVGQDRDQRLARPQPSPDRFCGALRDHLWPGGTRSRADPGDARQLPRKRSQFCSQPGEAVIRPLPPSREKMSGLRSELSGPWASRLRSGSQPLSSSPEKVAHDCTS